jgi:hypothetical protein
LNTAPALARGEVAVLAIAEPVIAARAVAFGEPKASEGVLAQAAWHPGSGLNLRAVVVGLVVRGKILFAHDGLYRRHAGSVWVRSREVQPSGRTKLMQYPIFRYWPFVCSDGAQTGLPSSGPPTTSTRE